MNFNKTLSVAALAMLVASGGAFAQVKKKPAAHKATTTAPAKAASNLLPVDPNVIIGKLPNGLTYYIRANSEPRNRAVLYLVNKAGSVLETDPQEGLAHFTEHMAFNGTRDFPKNQLIDYLQKAGIKFGADLNAYTTFDQTIYQLPLPTDSTKVFEEGFNILANWAGYVTFDPAELDRERGVVLEEARLRGKNAQERLQKQILPVLLNNSRYAIRLPIGKEDIIKTADVATIKSFYHDWYRPDLQAVIAVGDFDPKRVEQLIKEDFSPLKNPTPEKPRTYYDDPATPGTKVVIATDPEFPYTVAEIIIKHPETITKTTADYLQNVRVNLFNQMLSDRLGELTQKPNPPFLYGAASYGALGLGRQDAFTSIAVAKSAGELQLAVKAVQAEVDRVHKFGFTNTELERAKQNELLTFEKSYKERDKTESVNFVNDYQENFLTGEAIPGIDYEYNFYVNNINKVSLAELNAMAGKFISDQNRVIVIEAPEREKSNLPDEKTLLGWINTAGDNVKPYVDSVSSKPLLSIIPTGTKVVKQETDDSIATTTLTLGNGVKVILKPTNFKNDQIMISGYSFGGTSLANDDDFTSADFAAGIIGNSGVAGFNQVQLNKLLAGREVTLSPYISATTQGIAGNTTPRDLETTLQLLYLYFTQPRKDADVWASNMQQAKSFLANRSLDPTNVYKDTVAAVLSNYNFRSEVTTIDQVNNASLDKAYAFYKSRFADASGFTFTIVGSFSPDNIIPLLQTYLGGLPSYNHPETYKNLNIHPPAGQIAKTVYAGIGDKATVQLVFSGPYEYSEANNIQLDALESILQIKLTERLREQESGVYSPGVHVDYVKIPDGRYNLNIYFGCAPENVEKLIASTIDEINKIKQSGAVQTDIDKFKAEDTRSTEVQLRENIFWAGYIAGGAQNQENPHRIINFMKDLATVTPQSTKDAANKYLSGENFIRLVLMPQKK